MSVICAWSTYNGTHCRRTICKNKLCSMHLELVKEFKKSDDYCDYFTTHKIKPRNIKHVRSKLKEFGYTTLTLPAIVEGSDEDANIENDEYIMLESDQSKYKYCEKKEISKITLVFRDTCNNKSVVNYNDKNYCENCFKKLKNVPKINSIKDFID